MLIALDKNNKRTHIDLTEDGNCYFCPECGEKLVMRKGNIKAHHFAHYPHTNCVDNWHYDMTDWHYEWQNRFPVDCQEVVKKNNNQIHRADVLLEDSKIVYEFQHSPLSLEEFNDRNNFYNALGYKVVWIFDVEEQIENELLENYDNNKWSWKHAKSTFVGFNPKGQNLLFLQTNNSEDDNELVLVKWCLDEGLKRFATDGYSYYISDVVHMFDTVKYGDTGSNVKFFDLQDKLIPLFNKGHSTYYFGCPISPIHQCSINDIDLSEEDLKTIKACSRCKHCDYNGYDLVCNKRFSDLKIPSFVNVRILEKNKNNFVTKISYIQDDKSVILDIPAPERDIYKSVYQIWKEKNLKVGIFKNIENKKYIKITKDPGEQFRKYKKVYGYFTYDEYNFPKESGELYGLNDPVWIDIWSITNDK